jgi:hypothetical protein
VRAKRAASAIDGAPASPGGRKDPSSIDTIRYTVSQVDLL